MLKLTTDDIERHWTPVARGFQAGLVMLRDSCGVLNEKWLPYGYMLVPMAALWEEHLEVAGPSAAANRAKLQQWFWCAALNARYDRAANTQAAKDYAELARWFGGGAPPDAVTEFAFDKSRLGSYTPRQQSIYKALMALVLRRRILDFHRAETLSSSSIVARGIDDHHIFPRAYLSQSAAAANFPTELVDSILNRTMIDRETNIRIGKRAPSDYLKQIRDGLEHESIPTSLEDILRTHGMPAEPDSPLFADDFEGFLAKRRAFFVSEIEAATGRSIDPKGEVVPDDLDAVA